MSKFIIIVHVYDQENSQAYPLGGVFQSHKAAEDYITEHYQEVKKDHWTSCYEEGVTEGYKEGFTAFGGWVANDYMDGASLEIAIYEVEEVV